MKYTYTHIFPQQILTKMAEVCEPLRSLTSIKVEWNLEPNVLEPIWSSQSKNQKGCMPEVFVMHTKPLYLETAT